MSEALSTACKRYASGTEFAVHVFTHEDCLDHLRFEKLFPEIPDRLEDLFKALCELPADLDLKLVRPSAADIPKISRVHEHAYVLNLEAACVSGKDVFMTPDNPIGVQSFDSITAAAGCADALGKHVGAGGIGFSLTRPPGHHAGFAQAEGFCFINNVVMAAYGIRDIDPDARILIVDFDAHHGNGTQDLVEHDPSTAFLSLHADPTFAYPGTGHEIEQGKAEGLGTIVNVPLALGTGGDAWLEVFEQVLFETCSTFAPTHILVSAGYDAHEEDPMELFALQDHHFHAATRALIAASDQFCERRIGFVLEGGYEPALLARLIPASLEQCCELNKRMAMRTSQVLHVVYQDAAQHGSVILRDGTSAEIVQVQADDRQSLYSLIDGLSEESRQLRFFSSGIEKDAMVDMLAPSETTETFVVRRNIRGESVVLASASWFDSGKGTAEFAVVVADAFHGLGLGTILLERLAAVATMKGFTHFVAHTSASNSAMVDVFRHSGFGMTETWEDDWVTFHFSVKASKDSLLRSAQIDRVFTTASLLPFFRPQRIAFWGALHEGGVGQTFMVSAKRSGFQGDVFAVEGTDTTVPAGVDLLVAAVPEEERLPLLDACAQQGVRAMMFLSPDWHESWGEHRDHRSLRQRAHIHGMRLLGPESLGLINTSPDAKLNLTSLSFEPTPGSTAIYSQSGALGHAILRQTDLWEIGISSYVSVGERADVSGNDLIQYWEEDERTQIILMYLEGFRNPQRFRRIAHRICRKKPIVCLQGGVYTGSSRAHDATAAEAEIPINALLNHAGILRAKNVEELLGITSALAHQPLPQNNRVAIVTNVRSVSILCSDRLKQLGLRTPPLPLETQRSLVDDDQPHARVNNPVECKDPDRLEMVIDVLMNTVTVDAIIVIHLPSQHDDHGAMLSALGRATAKHLEGDRPRKPLLAVTMQGKGNTPNIQYEDLVIPTYPYVENAVRVLAKLHAYAAWRRKPPGSILEFGDMAPERAVQLLSQATPDQEGWLARSDVDAVLSCLGIRVEPGAGEDLAGVPLLAKVVHTPSFGSLIAFGQGGPYADVLKDFSYRPVPITTTDARDMLRETRVYRLLQGYRQHPPADIDALEELLMRLSIIAQSVPAMQTLELNPIRSVGANQRFRIHGGRLQIDGSARETGKQ